MTSIALATGVGGESLSAEALAKAGGIPRTRDGGVLFDVSIARLFSQELLN
ncbi:hypothetical protein J3R74_002504 [Puniceicoccus vermicola]